jgi:hypothetical protein
VVVLRHASPESHSATYVYGLQSARPHGVLRAYCLAGRLSSSRLSFRHPGRRAAVDRTGSRELAPDENEKLASRAATERLSPPSSPAALPACGRRSKVPRRSGCMSARQSPGCCLNLDRLGTGSKADGEPASAGSRAPHLLLKPACDGRIVGAAAFLGSSPIVVIG